MFNWFRKPDSLEPEAETSLPVRNKPASVVHNAAIYAKLHRVYAELEGADQPEAVPLELTDPAAERAAKPLEPLTIRKELAPAELADSFRHKKGRKPVPAA